MKLFSVRGTLVRVHPMFIVVIALFFHNGAVAAVCAYFLTLVLHESAHWLAAQSMKLHIPQLELTPFGGSMQMDLTAALPFRQSFVLSAAGPFVNLLFLLISLIFISQTHAQPDSFTVYFLAFNCFMLLMNLIPVLPLDGGRMLLAFLASKADYKRVMKSLLICGRIISVGLVILGCFLTLQGRSAFSLCILGFYLLYSAALEEKNGTARYFAAFIARRVRFEKNKTMPLQHIAVASDTPLFMLLPHLRPGAYHIIEVLQSDALISLGQLNENSLLECILQNSAMTLAEALQKCSSEK